MKHLIIFLLSNLLVFISPVSQALAQETAPEALPVEKTFDDGYKDGTRFAHDHYKAGKWFGMGFLGGLLIYGPVGTGITAGVSQLKTPQLPAEEEIQFQNKSQEYQNGFQQGYVRRAKAKALGQSLLGGATGTVGLVGLAALAFAAMSSSDWSGSGAIN